jgi:hypothetical protein
VKEKEGRGRREKGGAGGACYCAVVGVETMKQSHSKIFRAIGLSFLKERTILKKITNLANRVYFFSDFSCANCDEVARPRTRL